MAACALVSKKSKKKKLYQNWQSDLGVFTMTPEKDHGYPY